MAWEITIKHDVRTGVYNSNSDITYRGKEFKAGAQYPVHILGAFQEEDTPVFICEFEDGFVMNIYTEFVKLNPRPDDMF